ncbi:MULTISPECIES: efflux RND transporter periplasmic adaptor subunit [unclassified Janthinobacterium]|uniref:efflux RND transporter periplasmic adaptor subunit n=1 Tax=unclassified Janthinobacterium TaxID=2610881 RepID=UPI0017B8C865|nr:MULTISPECIES: efflux RND transporter periplasmic adaptor subunit [unclassified Janthinobacterium]MBB5609406.1 RND family efflux transporter MFP subunit [Janthinobacterium sp. S3T4]MBB5614579.1 RND family efflux transporter MFP subunit [Janthinobacterium sp. S3M3]
MFALKTLRPETGAPVFFALRPMASGALALALAVTLSACSKPAPKVDEVRPVRAIVLSSSNVDVNAEFAGEVVPRVVSQLGFRVGGKIVARKVDVGTVVKRGQVLMQLDPQDLQLSQAQAKASLASAETNRDLARAELKRYQDLRDKNFVSQTVLDSKDATYKAAQSNVDAAQAAYRGQANQSGYASLLADVDGVVTRIDAEAGQVVAAGTPVVQVARSGDKEIAIGLPEDKVETMRGVKDVVVRLWADPSQALAGKIREISPVADPATRTYQAKVTIPDLPQARLGMTAVVQFASQTAMPQIRVPLTALFNEKSQSSVWVVENGAVQRVAVTVGGVAGNDLLLSSGVKAGQTVVTAGANVLKPGQKVSILGTGLAPMAGSAAPAGAGVAK